MFNGKKERKIKKLKRIFITILAIGTGAVGCAYGWFIASDLVTKTYQTSVVECQGMTLTQTSCNNGTISPLVVTASQVVDANGNTSSAYYEETYTVAVEGKKKFQVKSIEFPTEALGSAVRVEVILNGSVRLYAPSTATATTNYDTIGDLVGVVNGTGNLTVRILLDGNDAACTAANRVDNFTTKITFEGVDL